MSDLSSEEGVIHVERILSDVKTTPITADIVETKEVPFTEDLKNTRSNARENFLATILGIIAIIIALSALITVTAGNNAIAGSGNDSSVNLKGAPGLQGETGTDGIDGATGAAGPTKPRTP